MTLGRIIRSDSDQHREFRTLLPWYVTGKLDAAEHAGVEAHLEMCLDCSAELELERLIGQNVTTMAIDIEQGWAAMEQRLLKPRPGVDRFGNLRQRVTAAVQGLRHFGRGAPPWLGWALAAQLVVVAIAGVLIVPRTQPATYHALGAQPENAAGNAVVIFRPETSERDLRQLLRANDARVVDGPTSTDAYILHIPAGQRASALASLRQQPKIVLAQPIDAASSP